MTGYFAIATINAIFSSLNRLSLGVPRKVHPLYHVSEGLQLK